MRPLITEDEIDLIAVWERFKSYWYVIVVTTLIISLIGAFVAYKLPPKYIVTTSIRVPSSWDISTNGIASIITNISNKPEYSTNGNIKVVVVPVPADQKDTRMINISLTTKDISKSQESLSQMINEVNSTVETKRLSENAVNKLNQQLNIYIQQIDDAYQKQKIITDMLNNKTTSPVIISDPLQINESIVALEKEKIELENKILTGKKLIYEYGPLSDGNNTQISIKIVLLFSIIAGLGIGSFITLLIKPKLNKK